MNTAHAWTSHGVRSSHLNLADTLQQCRTQISVLRTTRAGASVGVQPCCGRIVMRYSSFLGYNAQVPVLVPSGAVRDERLAHPLSKRSQRVAKQKIVSLWETLEEPNRWLDQMPPLTPGLTGVSEYTVQPFQVLSLHPRIVVYPGFINNATASVFIDQAERRLTQSKLALRKGETQDSTKDVRTSSGTFLDARGDHTGTLKAVEERLSQLSGIPTSHFEPYNVLRYNLGQHYDAHHDVFDPATYGPQASSRVVTVLIYLAAPEEGGETIFPLEGVDGLKNAKGFDFKSCDRGLKYTPRFGDAVMFWSVNVNGEFDKSSLHGGCPVKAGTKWVATKWIRDQPL